MNSQTVTIAEGAGFNQSLGFAARTAIVDNYTGSYLYLTQADRHVPPYTAGFTTPITPTDAPVVEWATPATIPVNAITGGQAKIVFTDASLPPSNGTTVYQSTVQNEILMDTVTVAQGGSSTHNDIKIPTGAQVLGVLQTPNTIAGSLTVTGHQSGHIYYNNPIIQTPQMFFVTPVLDTSVDWQFTDNGIGGGSVGKLIAILAGGMVAVQPWQGSFFVVPIDTTSVLVGSTIVNGHIITIPAGRKWNGTLWAAGQPGAGDASVSMQTAGAGVTPAAATGLLAMFMKNAGAAQSMVIPDVFVIAPPGNAAFIDATFGGTIATAEAGCSGTLL